MMGLALNHKIIVEAAGAIAATALRQFQNEHSIAIVSGGNIELSVLASLLSERNFQCAAS